MGILVVKRLIAIILVLSIPLQAAAPPAGKCDQGGFAATTNASCALSGMVLGQLIACVIFVQSTTITISSFSDGGTGQTWHTIGPVIGSNNETFIIWAIDTGSTFATTGVVLSANGTGDTFCAEYSNMASVGTVADCNSAGSSGNSTSLTSGSCTPSAANDVILGGGGSMANSITYTAGGSFTIEAQDAHSTQGNSAGWEDENSASCSSQAATMTASGSAAQWSMIMAAFKTNSPTSCSSPPQGGVIFLKGGSTKMEGGTVKIK